MPATTIRPRLAYAVTPARLYDEVDMMLNGAAAALATRRDHPSYRVRKRDVQVQLDQAEGALRLLGVLTGRTLVGTVSSAILRDEGTIDAPDRLYRLSVRRIELSRQLVRDRGRTREATS